MTAPVKTGDILADKYRVEKVLGIGGMGVVVAAQHMALHQKVALKFMLPDALADEVSVERFMREARAAVRLKSEHVARVLDVGCLDNGAPYIVMEFLDGEDMDDVIHRDAPMPPQVAVDFVLQACVAMAEAHSIGIVHRDLKPANLFVTKRPDGSAMIKVLDFGISKVQGVSGEVSNTKSSMAMGSPGYMAPEQMRSAKHADHRADIWALGTILYELLSKRRPFEAESTPVMFAAVLTGERTPLTEVLPDVDPGLAAVVHCCLERERDDRYGSVALLAKALAPFGDDKAAAMAASIANTGVGALPELATDSDAKPTVPMKAAKGGLPSTKLSDSMETPASAPSRPPAQTTHGASIGQVAVSTEADDGEGAGGGRRIALIAASLAVAALALGASQLFSGSASPSSSAPSGEVAPAALPVLADAGVPDAEVVVVELSLIHI